MKTKLSRWQRLQMWRPFIGIVMLAIGISATVIFYEGKKLAAEHRETMRAYESAQRLLDEIKNSKENGVPVEETKRTDAQEKSDSKTGAFVAPAQSEGGNISSLPAPGNIEKIADKIRILESSGGKNDSCLSKGKINGYGFRQSTFDWKCYDSHSEVRAEVENWIKDKIAKGYDEPTMLCLYNRGVKTGDCDYYAKYLALR